MSSAAVPTAHKRRAGMEAIILYKLVKAALEAFLGLAAVWLVLRGAEAGAATLAEAVLEHVTRAWALKAATLVVEAATSARVKFVAVASFADALLSAVEGIALQTERPWAPWLVVIATGSLLPWEVWEALRHPKWIRLVLLLLNAAVVLYLLREVIREHRARLRGAGEAKAPADGPTGGP